MSAASSALAAAFTKLEGVDPVYNNPGAISGTGDTGTSFGAGIGIYSTLEAGEAALQNQVSGMINGTSSIYNPSMTIQQAGSMYESGSTTGNPSYGTQLANVLGIDPSTTLGDFASGNTAATSTSLQSSILSAATDGVSDFFTAENLENIIFVVIGILLIAAGVFAFKTSQTVIQVAGNAAKKVAKNSAEVGAIVA